MPQCLQCAAPSTHLCPSCADRLLDGLRAQQQRYQRLAERRPWLKRLAAPRPWKDHARNVLRYYALWRFAAAALLLAVGVTLLPLLLRVRCFGSRTAVVLSALVVGLSLGHFVGAAFHRGAIGLLIGLQGGFRWGALLRQSIGEHSTLPLLALILVVLLPLGSLQLRRLLPSGSVWADALAAVAVVSIFAAPIALIGTGLSAWYHGQWTTLALKRLGQRPA